MDMHSEHLISHPDQVPVEIDRISRKQAPDHLYMGELAVNSEARIGVGTEVRLHMPTVDPDAKLCGRVIWLHERGDGFVLGISFHSHSEAFRMRMLEQLCHMAAFREQVAGEGRLLSENEAAREWIRRFSKDFPEVAPVQLH